MEPPNSDTEWSTVIIRAKTFSRLSEFVDAYNILAKGKGVDRLLAIADGAGVPLTAEQEPEDTEAPATPDVDSICGFVFESDETPLNVVGIDGSRAHLTTDLEDESVGQVQPLGQSQIHDGTVYCPVCAEEVLDYELPSHLPTLQSGFFADMSVDCPTCDASRKHFTLFVAKRGVEPQPAALRKAMKLYFAWLLVLQPVAHPEFKRRITACQQLASDGGWSWLPDPSLWIGYNRDERGPVDAQDYTEFLEAYIRLLIDGLGSAAETGQSQSNSALLETESHPPNQPAIGESADENQSEWQISIEKRGPLSAQFKSVLSGLDSEWDTAGLDSQEVSPSGFADDALVVSLTGLSEL